MFVSLERLGESWDKRCDLQELVADKIEGENISLPKSKLVIGRTLAFIDKVEQAGKLWIKAQAYFTRQ